MPRVGVSKPTRRDEPQPPHSPPQRSPAAGRKTPVARVSGLWSLLRPSLCLRQGGFVFGLRDFGGGVTAQQRLHRTFKRLHVAMDSADGDEDIAALVFRRGCQRLNAGLACGEGPRSIHCKARLLVGSWINCKKSVVAHFNTLSIWRLDSRARCLCLRQTAMHCRQAFPLCLLAVHSLRQ